MIHNNIIYIKIQYSKGNASNLDRSTYIEHVELLMLGRQTSNSSSKTRGAAAPPALELLGRIS